jgi:lipoate---protein ligase
VYQDLGNMCFTFVSNKKNIEKNNQILIDALSKFKIPQAVPSGRNDITIDGKKISGSAFKQQEGRALHHGTMLMNVDMNAMKNYLNPNKKKLEVQQIRSKKRVKEFKV